MKLFLSPPANTMTYTALSLCFASYANNIDAQNFADPQNTSHPQTVIVSSNPLGKADNMQILTPAKVLSGEELRNKLGSSIGETLSSELGVSASGFGTASSRPIIRGLEGPRVKMLQNGMAVADLSALSNDHAVASETANSQQIEILRGAASLLYGSGAIGGLVNVVDGRIPQHLNPKLEGEAEVKWSSVSKEKAAGFYLDGGAGKMAWHIDANRRLAQDYAILRPINGNGVLENSRAQEGSLGLGTSFIENWGHIGFSLQHMKDKYGIPTDEQSKIDLKQNRFDGDMLIKQPWAGFENFRFKIASTQYQHMEIAKDEVPASLFKNKALETRLTINHAAKDGAGWEGSWGLQTESATLSALAYATGRADTIPVTDSKTQALFGLEQRDMSWGSLSAGLRFESVKRQPIQSELVAREFGLFSASMGAMLPINDTWKVVSSYALAERAPAVEELFSKGPHESTASFDIGNPDMRKEKSKNIELGLQAQQGDFYAKWNLFRNRMRDYVYGEIKGIKLNEEGEVDPDGEFLKRNWKQSDATLQGYEIEWGFNPHGAGWSTRVFFDSSRGRLASGEYLPLQAAKRLGWDVGYKYQAWRANMLVLHAMKQDHLASYETYVTPSFTKVDFNLSYTHEMDATSLTWFAQIRNALNQDIRLATSLLKERNPQPKRSVLLGLRLNW